MKNQFIVITINILIGFILTAMFPLNWANSTSTDWYCTFILYSWLTAGVAECIFFICHYDFYFKAAAEWERVYEARWRIDDGIMNHNYSATQQRFVQKAFDLPYTKSDFNYWLLGQLIIGAVFGFLSHAGNNWLKYEL